MDKWMRKVKEGDKLMPNGWNKTEGVKRQLHTPTDILEVDLEAASESKITYLVQFKNKDFVWLDASWFHGPEGESKETRY